MLEFLALTTVVAFLIWLIDAVLIPVIDLICKTIEVQFLPNIRFFVVIIRTISVLCVVLIVVAFIVATVIRRHSLLV